MNPEPKDDGRLKMRFLVMGHTEAKHLTSNTQCDSPTPAASIIKLVLALGGEDCGDGNDDGEEIAVGDIGTASLKDPCRHVAYKAHRDARLRVSKLKGSLHGQSDAPTRWWETIEKCMVKGKALRNRRMVSVPLGTL